MSTLNLPPLPESFRHFPKVERDMMQAHALAAYLAGRDAGLDEALRALDQAYQKAMRDRLPDEDLDDNDGKFNIGQLSQAFAYSHAKGLVQALKSDAKGGV